MDHVLGLGVDAPHQIAWRLEHPRHRHHALGRDTSHVGHRVFSTASRRSYPSRAPDSIPEAIMPSRSSRLSKVLVEVMKVRPPRSSSTSVFVEMWPGRPSHSNVITTRCGGTSSLKMPRKPDSPSGPFWTKRHAPPGRASSLSTMVSYRAGPHHCGMSPG